MNNSYSIKAVLFDKDGTLIDCNGAWFPIYMEIAKQLTNNNIEKTRELIEAGGGDFYNKTLLSGSVLSAGTTTEICETWAKVLVDINPEQIEQCYNKVSSELLPKYMVEIVNTKSLFDELSQMGIKVGIATMDSVSGLNIFMEKAGLAGKDNIFKAGFDSGYGQKPDAGMVNAFAEYCQIDNDQIMMVGDNNHDIHMGINAKCGASVGVLSGNSTADDLPQASDIIDHIGHIPQLIKTKYCQN